jgi:hypothetical protein
MQNTKRAIADLFFWTMFACLVLVPGVSAQSGGATAEAERITGDTFTVTARTPRGANIFAVSKPSTAMMQAIDKGLTDLFAVARKNGYRKHLSYSDYTVFIAKADRTKSADGSYSPDIAVGAAQYAGTQYDKGGYIYAAGMVVSNSPSSFVIAEHTKSFDRVSNVVRYEGEHLVLFFNDRRRYEATKDHSKGGSHPILQ